VPGPLRAAGRAARHLLGWIRKALRSPLSPVKKVACSMQKHLCSILNVIALKATNAASESVNARVRRIKRTACNSRSRECFDSAYLFHREGCDLYSVAASAPHTTSDAPHWKLTLSEFRFR
jgi:transposase